MIRRAKRIALVALTPALVLAASAIPASGGATPLAKHKKEKKVNVADDYYAPVDVSIKKGTKVKWKWSKQNIDSHNVRLTNTHPKGVKKGDFKSATGTYGIKFNRKFKKPGTYGFICTIHPTVMQMTVTVKK